MQKDLTFGFVHYSLDKNSLRLVGFSGSLFADNTDFNTQREYVKEIIDLFGTENIIYYYMSHKLHRFVRNVAGVETRTFGEAFSCV